MKDNEGFTLIELLIVVAIIGILSIAATTAYVGVMRKAARSEAYANLDTLRLLQEQFYAENGDYITAAVNPIDYNATANPGDNGIEDFLTGFKPGGCRECAFPYGLNYTYEILQNVALPPGIIPVPYEGETVAQTPCFVAVATGVTGSRVCPNGPGPECDIFAIDCMNSKNY